MAKATYRESASLKQKKSFAHFLSEDEELVLATGFGKNFMRHKFAYYMVLPGCIFWILGLGAAYYYHFNLGVGLLAGYLISMVFALIKCIWTYHSHRYLLTTRRVIVKIGYFNVKLTSALYDKITHIEVDQSFIDRVFFKHGAIIINTAGTAKDEMNLENVDAPIEFKNLLERLINRERVQVGRPTGPVFTVEGEIVEK